MTSRKRTKSTRRDAEGKKGWERGGNEAGKSEIPHEEQERRRAEDQLIPNITQTA